ncbi:MAG: hypothetical protein KQI35_11205 [Bacteroidetes bacterium]|nr:hypothetical protein [Bacteroidota bacterium]
MKRTLLFYLLILSLTSTWAQTTSEYLDFAIKYTEENKHDEAIKVCDKLLEMLPNSADIFYLRGVNRYLKSDFEGAILDFDSTLSINPNHSDAYFFRAKSKRALKDYWGAFRDLNKAKDENFYSTISTLAGDMVRSIFRKSNE